MKGWRLHEEFDIAERPVSITYYLSRVREQVHHGIINIPSRVGESTKSVELSVGTALQSAHVYSCSIRLSEGVWIPCLRIMRHGVVMSASTT